MIRPPRARWTLLLFAGVFLAFADADAQQSPQTPIPTAGPEPVPDGNRGFL